MNRSKFDKSVQALINVAKRGEFSSQVSGSDIISYVGCMIFFVSAALLLMIIITHMVIGL